MSAAESFVAVVARPRWQDDAACRGQWTRADFFPRKGEVPRAALALCGTCPVTGECLSHALRNNEHGVWGGTQGRERERLRRYREGIR